MSTPNYSSADSSAGENFFTIHFDAALDAANPPPIGAFSVQVNGTSVAIASVTVDSGAHTVFVTLSHGALLDGDIVQFTYTDPTGGNDANAIQGLDGSDAASFSDQLVVQDATAPAVASVAVPANGVHGAGDPLDFIVTFDETVTVDTSGGTPAIQLVVGSTLHDAAYVSGSGTSQLVFSYTPQAGDQDNNGVTVGSLGLNGATITDAAGNDATLTLNSVGSTAGVLVDAVAPTTTVSSITLSSDTGSSVTDFITNTASQTISGTLSATLAADESVEVSLNNGASWFSATSAVGSSAWSTSVTLSGSDTLQVRVVDAAGNAGTALAHAYTLDTTATAPSTPDMTAGSDSGASSTDNITNQTTPVFTGTAESGSSVTLYDTDGTTVLGTATAAGGTWSLTSSPLSSGTHQITAKATDLAGNLSAASAAATVTVDTVGPTGMQLSATTVSTSAATAGSTLATLSSTDASAVTYDFAVGNGVIDADNGKFTISGASLNVDGSSLAAGAYHIYLAATDAAGNGSYQIFTLDVLDSPSISSITRAGGASATTSTDASTVAYTVAFDQSVAGVDATDFTLTPTGTASGSIASISGSGTTYTVIVNQLTGDGMLRLDLNSSGTGIQNASSVAIAGGYTSGETYTLDHTAPSAPSSPDMSSATDTGVSSTDNITNQTTPVFTGTAESGATVTLYDSDGTTVLGATTAAGGTWSLTSSTLSAGTHTLTAKATDAAGNVSAASSGQIVTIDTTSPSVTITSDHSALKVGETATITFTFSEDPGSTFSWDGSSGDVTVSGGVLSAISGSGLTRTAVFTPNTDTQGGVASITVAASSYTDVAGNNGGAGTSPSLSYDTAAPTVAITTDAASLKAGETATVTFSFSEAVSGFTNADLTIPHGTLSAVSSNDGGLHWSATYTPDDGVDAATNVITLAAGGVTDLAGNANAAASSGNFAIDTLRPTAVIALSDSTLTIGETAQVTVTFSEAVTGFTDADLTADHGTLSNLSSSDGGVTWTATFTPDAGISATGDHITLDVTGVQNAAGNAGAGTAMSAGYDINTVAAPPPPPPPPPPSQPPVVVVTTPTGSIVTGDATDNVIAHSGSGADTVSAGGGADTVGGGDLNDVLQGNTGNDTITGGAGADLVYGGQGADTVQGNTGDDMVFGDKGDDQVLGGQGTDTVQGGQGDDYVSGDKGDDVVHGGQGDDHVLGGEGDDWLSGDLGDDTLSGGAGADTFHSFAGSGLDVVTDFNLAEGDRVQLDPGTAYTLQQQGADLHIVMNGAELVLQNVQLSSLSGDWIVA